MDLALVVGTDAVLDAVHRFDLTLDGRAVVPRLSDNLDRLPGVLADIETGSVKQHRIPARLKAGRDPLSIRTVVEMQRHRDRQLVSSRPPDAVELASADLLDRLQRGLHDQRRLEFRRCAQDRVEREVVDDVDRRYAIAIRERRLKDLASGDHRIVGSRHTPTQRSSRSVPATQAGALGILPMVGAGVAPTIDSQAGLPPVDRVGDRGLQGNPRLPAGRVAQLVEGAAPVHHLAGTHA